MAQSYLDKRKSFPTTVCEHGAEPWLLLEPTDNLLDQIRIRIPNIYPPGTVHRQGRVITVSYGFSN